MLLRSPNALDEEALVDYYQAVVMDYLRADRKLFLNAEFCIQLGDYLNPDRTKHWYCDALTVDFGEKTIWLVEISFADQLRALRKRLMDWENHWDVIPGRVKELSAAGSVYSDWFVRPWLFVRSDLDKAVRKRLEPFEQGCLRAKVDSLDNVLPWTYASWNRPGVTLKHMKKLKSELASVSPVCSTPAHEWANRLEE
jgi:hypothetical protein